MHQQHYMGVILRERKQRLLHARISYLIGMSSNEEMSPGVRKELYDICGDLNCSISSIREEVEGAVRSKLCISCLESPGEMRIDNSIPAGVHCQECWDKLIESCRSRSW